MFMSLRPRSARNEVPRERVSGCETPSRRSASVMMRPVFDRTAASIDGFVSVPDTMAYEGLVKRVADLEAQLGSFSVGYRSFESTYRAQTAQIQEHGTRISSVEQACERMSGELKLLEGRVAANERHKLRIDSLMHTLQNEYDRCNSDIRRLNAVCSKNGDEPRHQPKGFQENDTPLGDLPTMGSMMRR